MKEFQGFKCDHCGKLYQKKHACEKHEGSLCRKHPNNSHPCWFCPHLSESTIDHFRGEDPYMGEIWVKSRSYYCKKKEVNLYSYGYDKHITSYDPAQQDESKPLERMPSKINPCKDFKEIDYSNEGIDDLQGEF